MSSTAYPVVPQRVYAQPIGPLRNTLVLAARSVANPDTVTASILQEAEIGNAVRISFDQPIGDISNLPTTWQLAIRSTNPAGAVERYLLVRPQTGAILWPDYEGQTVFPDAVLELWSVPGAATAVVSTAVTMTLGTFSYPDESLLFAGSYPTASQTIV